MSSSNIVDHFRQEPLSYVLHYSSAVRTFMFLLTNITNIHVAQCTLDISRYCWRVTSGFDKLRAVITMATALKNLPYAGCVIEKPMVALIMMTSSNGNIFRVIGPLCGEFTGHRSVTRSFDVFFDLRPNKWLRKQSCGWWFETPSRPLWHHCNDWQVRFLKSSWFYVHFTRFIWALVCMMYTLKIG